MQNFRSIARRRHLSSKRFRGQRMDVKQIVVEKFEDKIEEPQVKKTTKQPKTKPLVEQMEEIVVTPVETVEENSIVENKE